MHITDTCNNSCEFCVVDSCRESKEKVNREAIIKFLNDNKDKDYNMVNIHGGEPTLVDELPVVLDEIRNAGYKAVSIQTNARRFSNMEFAKDICSRGAELMVVSLHGCNKETHDAITNVDGSFEEAVKGIKNIKSLGKKVRTNTVVCLRNKDQIVDIIKYAIDLGVDHANISNIHPTGKAFKNFKKTVPTLKETIESVKKAVDYAVSKGCTVTVEGYPYCVLGEYVKYAIKWDEAEFKLLYHDRVMENYDEFMRNETRIKGTKCKQCKDVNKCGGVYKEYIMFNGWHEINEAYKDV